MKIKFQKSGNSLVLPIPVEFAESFRVGDEVEVSFVDEQLVVVTTNLTETEYQLEDLLAQVTEENQHKGIWE